jgi:RND family efflux transporter MFP subunit
MRVSFAIPASLVVTTALTACARDEAAPAPPPPPQVSVAQVKESQVTDFDELTGHFEAVERVELRPRVSGYISSVNFVQGHEVKKGDVLFVIDPRPYEAEVKRTRAQLAQARSQLALAKSEHDRAIKLMEQHAISREEFDTRTAGTEQAQGAVDAAQAAVDAALLNLEFTRVTAPIAGVVGRAAVTAGNLVTGGSTLLTTLVSIDPIYVTFESDEQTYLKDMSFARKSFDGAHQDVWVGLADETGFPHEGEMVFVNNEVDPATGTVRARGLFENRGREFTPGMFARVRLPGGSKYEALLINDSAIGTDQSVKYVLRLGKGNTLEYRAVKLGPIVDGLRVVRDGLTASDVIVVNGMAKVRPGMVVTRYAAQCRRATRPV